MTTLFLVCAFLGASVLVLQLAAAFLGLDHHGDAIGVHAVEEGLHLFSVRALSAGVAFFGVGGLIGLSTRLGLLLAIPLGLVLGAIAMVGVAAAMRAMLRFEDDGTVVVDGAVGVSGVVYLSIPAGREGVGKVHLNLQNRTVELQAITAHDAPLVTGDRVLVVDVVGPDTVDVVPDPLPLPVSEDSHAGA